MESSTFVTDQKNMTVPINTENLNNSHPKKDNQNNAEVKSDWERCWEKVTTDRFDFESWEALIRIAETANGGVTKASDDADITNLKTVYDRFLAQFPLCYGYWKKYADWQLSLYDTVHAEKTYERAVVSISNSVDLWMAYLNFKTEFHYPKEAVRELFERAVTAVGYDFYAHPLWDKYIEFEEAQGFIDRVLAILERVIYIPLHQYARYYEKYTQVAMTRPVQELLPAEQFTQLNAEIRSQAVKFDELTQTSKPKTEQDFAQELQTRILTMKSEIYMATQAAVNARWVFEAEIKRPYFHVKPLDQAQLENWKKYLTFEEEQGDFSRTYILYERCLVPCALYPEFWSRYAQFLYHHGHVENARYAYQKATSIFIPLTKPHLKLSMAEFEECEGHVDTASKIYDEILAVVPDHFEVLKKRIYFEKRQKGTEEALKLLDNLMEGTVKENSTKSSLSAEKAKMMMAGKMPAEQIRNVLKQAIEEYGLSSPLLAVQYFVFELEDGNSKEIAHAWDTVFETSSVETKTKHMLAKRYAEYLLGSDDFKMYFKIQYYVTFGKFPATGSTKTTDTTANEISSSSSAMNNKRKRSEDDAKEEVETKKLNGADD